MFFKKNSTSQPVSLIMDEMIGSKSVMARTEETYEITVPANAETELVARKTLELKKYAELIGYSDAKINQRKENDLIVLWFRGVTSLRGTDYNPMVYGNITWVEDTI